MEPNFNNEVVKKKTDEPANPQRRSFLGKMSKVINVATIAASGVLLGLEAHKMLKEPNAAEVSKSIGIDEEVLSYMKESFSRLGESKRVFDQNTVMKSLSKEETTVSHFDQKAKETEPSYLDYQRGYDMYIKQFSQLQTEGQMEKANMLKHFVENK